ncbi:MAG: enoyl-ACP reductase FabI [Rickettsiales bacterium]|nr:enoyl-ACP reductase FabI [Rickettsiales bacterium]
MSENTSVTGIPEGGLMKGKKGIVLGLANSKSIAWGITNALAVNGAEMAFTYPNEPMKKRVQPLAESVGSDIVLECDVLDYQSIDNVFAEIKEKWGKLDFVVHSVAYSDKNELKGRYLDTSRDNFLNSMEISCFSFTAIAKAAASLMTDGGSMLTLTYDGANRVMPHYNVMGVCKAALEASVKYLACDVGNDKIRVNSISAGPIKTLASSAIGDFSYILKWNELNAPLKRNITIEEVGKSALFLLSDLGTGVTGENLMVDCGYHVVGMKAVDAPDIATV